MDKTFELTTVSKTLLIPLAARSQAHRWHPHFRDPFAEKAMAMLDAKFKIPQRALMSAPLRAHSIDQTVEKYFTDDTSGSVISLGSGLCSRAFRLNLPQVQFIDVDLAEVQKMKESLFGPAANLKLLTADFENPQWAVVLPDSVRPVLIIMEGLLHYLDTEVVKILFSSLRQKYPQAHFIFDSYSKWMIPFAKAKVEGHRPVGLKWGIHNSRRYFASLGLKLISEKSLIPELAQYSSVYKCLCSLPFLNKSYQLIELEVDRDSI